MSMKRTKQRTAVGGSRKADDEADKAWGKPAEPEPTWAEVEGQPEGSFMPFVLSSRYMKGNLILHSKFGKGLVLGVEGPRIEVLFEDGKKKLGHMVQ